MSCYMFIREGNESSTITNNISRQSMLSVTNLVFDLYLEYLRRENHKQNKTKKSYDWIVIILIKKEPTFQEKVNY